jgi:hypothetical protein
MKRMPPVIGLVLAFAVGIALGGVTVYFLADGSDAGTGQAANEPSAPVLAVGVVVDEGGSAVANADVRISAYSMAQEVEVGEPVPLLLQFITTADEQGRFVARLSPLVAGAVTAAEENGGVVNFDAEVFLEDGRSALWTFPRERLQAGWQVPDEHIAIEDDTIRLVLQ